MLGWMKIYLIYFTDTCFDKNVCLHTRYSIQNYFNHKNKNEIMIIENMLSLQVEKSSLGQMFALKTTNIYIYIYICPKDDFSACMLNIFSIIIILFLFL